MEDNQTQSVFVSHDMVIHFSAYKEYKQLYKSRGYTILRRVLRDRWYSRSDQDKIISKIHRDEHSHENTSIGS
jgi:hypothetical protein